MSKNIWKNKKPLLKGWSKNITTVAFGNGEILIGTASWPDNQHVLIFADTERPHEIGSNSSKAGKEWFEEVSGDVVVLGFNKPESIDVVIDFLNEIKAKLNKLSQEKETETTQHKGDEK